MTRQKKNNNKNPNSRIMQSKWKGVDHLILDEVSFIGQWVLNRVHQSLMIAKNSNSNFGGINILFCGDFCQLPPVNEEALYKLTKMESQKSGFVCNVCKSCKTNYSNKHKTNPSQYSIEKENGRLLWLQLTHVIILTKQMRQIEDPEFAALLKRLRVGECTDADFKLLNTRLISKNDLGDEWSEVPILVSRNILKMEINKIKIKIFAQKY